MLSNPDYVTDKEHFKTITGTTHDYKAHGGTLSNTQFKKAPGSWKVHYVEDNIGKVIETFFFNIIGYAKIKSACGSRKYSYPPHGRSVDFHSPTPREIPV